MKKGNIVKEIQLGETKVKFCNDFIAIEKDEREKRIQSFKQAYTYLLKGVDEKWVKNKRYTAK